MATNKLVIIDDGMVVSIITNSKITQAIHPIKVAADNAKSKGLTHNKGGCKPCQSKARNVAIDLMSIKQTIAQLSDDDRRLLKSLLDADKIRMVYTTQSNKLVQLTY